MPRDEEVTPRAGRLCSMTGFTEAECTALLPHVARARKERARGPGDSDSPRV